MLGEFSVTVRGSEGLFLATSCCYSALLYILTHVPMFVQAKEAGADDILDISACELTEVNYRSPNIIIYILVKRSSKNKT